MLNRGYKYREAIGPAHAGRTVLEHLAAAYAHTTADAWTTRLLHGEVTLDAEPARGDKVLRAGQVLVWQRPPWDEPEVPLDFGVLHDDELVLAVAKPSGLPTMPAGGFLEHTLLALVQARYPDARPLHRLGRFTSGVVLFARTAAAAARLGEAWRAHQVVKDYRGLGSGVATWDRRDVTTPIGPVPHPVLGSVHAAHGGGKPARSTVAVVERRAGTTLFDVRIATGRPHQIRIHLACVGHPLAGDPLYAAGGLPRPIDPGLPGDGGYLLHAWRLGFTHPASGAAVAIEAPLPPPLVEGFEAGASAGRLTGR